MALTRKTLKKGTASKVSVDSASKKAKVSVAVERVRTAINGRQIDRMLTEIEKKGEALSASADKLLRQVS